MLLRKIVLATLLAVSGAALAPAQAAVDVNIDIAPPAPRVEAVPRPRAGYVWSPGYWVWRGHHHVWVRGHWIRERRGYHWVPEHWAAAGPRWHFEPGHWER